MVTGVSPTRRTPDGASRLVPAMFPWSVLTRRASSRHCGVARVNGLTTTVMHEMSTPPPPPPSPPRYMSIQFIAHRVHSPFSLYGGRYRLPHETWKIIGNMLPLHYSCLWTNIGREVLDLAGKAVAVGATTDDIDRACHEATVARGAYPSPLNYFGFPKR